MNNLKQTTHNVSVTDDLLIQLIKKANNRISFIGTGFSKHIAESIVKKKDIVKLIVLDKDENTARTGYSNIEAIRLLYDNRINLQKLINIRLNMLVTDNYVTIYAPAALTVEAGPNGENFNGIIVPYSVVEDTIKQFFPPEEENQNNNNSMEKDNTPTSNISNNESIDQSKTDTINTENTEATVSTINDTSIKESADNQNEIIEEDVFFDDLPVVTIEPTPLQDEEIKVTEDAIKKNPIKEFDLSRKLIAYSSKLQFVKLTHHGFSIEKKTITVPKVIRLLAKGNETAENRLKATYDLIDNDNEAVISSKRIEKELEALEKDFIYQVKGFGKIILVEKKKDLGDRIEIIKEHIEAEQQTIIDQMKININKAVEDLANAFCPVLLNNPPPEFTAWIEGIDNKNERANEAKIYIKKLLKRAVNNSQKSVNKMGIDVKYYNATEEMLRSDEFKEAVMSTNLKDFINIEDLIEYTKGVKENDQ